MTWQDTSPEDIIEDLKRAKQQIKDGIFMTEPGMTGPQIEDEAEKVGLAELMVTFSMEFDDRTVERHRFGATKYGPAAFMSADTLEMAIEEVIDLANYARYTYMKLRLLQESIRDQIPEDGTIDTGFITARDATAVKETKS